MSMFSVKRFRRVMTNDALRVMRTVLYGSAAVLGVTVGIYLLAFRRAGAADDPVHVMLFGLSLVIAGLLFTGVSFQDLHHPLQRNHYLMLPCSNLERILSRYLLTGPLFVVYATLAFMAADYVGNQVTDILLNERQLLFSPIAMTAQEVIQGYLIAHMLVFIGAICFRSHALLRTVLFLAVGLFILVLFENLVERIFFPELYSWTTFENVQSFPLELQPWFTASWMNVVFVIGAFVWLLYVAYLCLRDYEATDGV
jgi:hypothetical protein